MTFSLDDRSRRVLVTGAGGFLGTHLVGDLARRGHDVVGVDLRFPRSEDLGVRLPVRQIEGDIADRKIQEDALSNVDTVFHLAAAHLGASTRREEFWRVNVEAVESLIQTATAAQVRRFVHCSSVGVFGRISNPPADEETPAQPELAYEETKLAGERVVQREIQDHQFPAIILRPAWVYGPGCPRTEKLFRAIESGRFVIAGKGQTYRHCIHIADMVRAFVLAAEREDALGQMIIVGDREAVTVRRLVDTIADLVGSSPPRQIPMSLMNLAAAAIEFGFKPLGKEPPISRRSLRFFTGNTSFVTDKAQRLLGFEPRFDIDSGLAEVHGQIRGRETSASVAGGAEI